MTVYEADKHELHLLKWWLDLRSNQEEFDNLFAKPLQSLTELLAWAKHTVQLAFESDGQGITMAAWAEPIMSGAFIGVWCRPDKRQTKAILRFVNAFYDAALEQFSVILNLTRRPELHRTFLRLGYRRMEPALPGLFEERDALIYYLTKETREAVNERRNRRYDALPIHNGNSADSRASSDHRHSGLVSGGGEGMAVSTTFKVGRRRPIRDPRASASTGHSNARIDLGHGTASRPPERQWPRQSTKQSSNSHKRRK